MDQSDKPGVLPNGGDLLKAGASGAAIAGTWTAIGEVMRVRNGDATPEEAVRTTANSVAIGAGAGAIAHVVSHAARQIPLLGLAAVAAAVLIYTNRPKETVPEQTEANDNSARVGTDSGPRVVSET